MLMKLTTGFISERDEEKVTSHIHKIVMNKRQTPDCGTQVMLLLSCSKKLDCFTEFTESIVSISYTSVSQPVCRDTQVCRGIILGVPPSFEIH